MSAAKVVNVQSVAKDLVTHATQRRCGQPSKPLNRSSVLTSGASLTVQRRCARQSVARRNTIAPIQAAASFQGGSGQASFRDSAPAATPKSGKVALYVLLWYASSIAFNIYNKQALNIFPVPWLIATVQLVGCAAAGLLLWATRILPAPKTSGKFWKALAPVAFFHTVGHVSACIAFGAMAVSFAHIIKSAEPVFSVILTSPLLGTSYPPYYVWLSLLPIVGGCALSSLKEVSFAWPGFWNASISNVGMVLRNIASKKMLKDFKDIGGINLFILISTYAIIFCAPVAYYMEGSKWGAALEAAKASVGTAKFTSIIISTIIGYTAYNAFSYLVLDELTSPVHISVGNTMKRVAVVVSSIVFFRNPVTLLNWVGSGLAIFGTYLYSLASQKAAAAKTA